MDWGSLLGVAATIVTALGGFEFIKWLANWFTNRKNNKRVEEASADDSEFSVLRKQIEFLQEQLLKKESVLQRRPMLCAMLHARSLS